LAISFLVGCGPLPEGSSAEKSSGTVSPSAKVTPILDDKNAVEALVPFSGGRIELTLSSGISYTLEIPGGALISDEKVTMTPIARIDGMGLPDGLIGGVQLEPDGLQLSIPATLTISVPKGYDPQRMIGIGYKGAGQDLQMEFAVGDGKSITLPIFSFSGHGAASGTAKEVADSHITIPKTGLFTEKFEEEKKACFAGDQTDKACKPLAKLLSDYFENYLKPGFKDAIKNKKEKAIDALIAEELAWAQIVSLLSFNTRVVSGYDFASLIEAGFGYDRWGLEVNFDIDAERCVQENDVTLAKLMFVRLHDLSLLAEPEDRYDVSNPQTWAKFEKCMRYRVEVVSSMEWKWGDGVTVFMIVKGRMLFRLKNMQYDSFEGKGDLYYEAFSAIFSGKAEELNQYCSIEASASKGTMKGLLTLGPPKQWIKVKAFGPDGTEILIPKLVTIPGREGDLDPQIYIFPQNMRQNLPKWKCANVTVPAASQMPLWWTGFYTLHEPQYLTLSEFGDAFLVNGFTTSHLERREADFQRAYDKSLADATVHEEFSLSIRSAPGAKD